MKQKSLMLPAAVLVLGLLVSGCAPETPTPTETTGTTTTPSPTATVTPTETTTAPTTTPTTTAPTLPELSSLVISSRGLSDLLIGGNAQSLADRTHMIVWNAEYCVRPDGTTADTEPGRWVPNFGDSPTFYGDSNTPFLIDAGSGSVLRIDVVSVEIRDENGLHIGSTRDEFLAAHPGAVVDFDGPMTDVYVISGSTGALVYEITRHDEGLPYWPADQQNKIVQIRALSPSYDPYFATAASGNLAGACQGI